MAAQKDNPTPSSTARTSRAAGGLARGGSTIAHANGQTSELLRLAKLFEPLPISADKLRQFARTEGSDEEPWDVLLSMLAIDEHQALDLLSQRTGMPFDVEPRLKVEKVEMPTERKGGVMVNSVDELI
jgi:hypothetical protein